MFYLYQQPVNCVPDTGERLDRGHMTEQLPHPLPYICDTPNIQKVHTVGGVMAAHSLILFVQQHSAKSKCYARWCCTRDSVWDRHVYYTAATMDKKCNKCNPAWAIQSASALIRVSLTMGLPRFPLKQFTYQS